MLSLGAAAFDEGGQLLVTFSANLAPLPGAAPDPDTLAWWLKHPEAWAECQRAPRPPEEVMPHFAAWLKDLPGKPVWMAYPLAFDFMFVQWYLLRFAGQSPLRHNGIDMRSYAMAMWKCEYQAIGIEDLRKRWPVKANPHPHNALYDAIEQGQLFAEISRQNRKKD